jgi:hypothetical protein
MKPPEKEDPAIEAARRAGFDIDLLESNLALTPEERAMRHASALELMLALREAGIKAREQSASAAPSLR